MKHSFIRCIIFLPFIDDFKIISNFLDVNFF